jgi:hypothetical protein
MAKQTIKSSNLVSYHYVSIRTSLNDLLKLFPHSISYEYDEKISYKFTLETNNGDVFTIYDYFMFPFKHDDEISWHIGARSKDIAQTALFELEEILINNK